MKKIRLVKKSIVYILGLLVLAIGIALSVKSNLGVSPVTSVPFVLGRIFGISLGTATVFIYILNMAVQAIVLRRDYRPVELLQIAISFLFGFFTDATLYLISFLPVTDNYIVRLVYLAAGISCIAFGVMLYLTTALLSLPTDGTVQAIAKKGKFKLHKVKIAYDSVSTALALILSLTVLHDFQGIGLGTIAASFGVGKMLGIFSTLFKKRLERFLYGKTGETDSSLDAPSTQANAKKAG